jgi:hypothetical protein
MSANSTTEDDNFILHSGNESGDGYFRKKYVRQQSKTQKVRPQTPEIDVAVYFVIVQIPTEF